PPSPWVRVALDVPLPGPFDYRCDTMVSVGQRVIVPFGRREMVGMVVDRPAAPALDPAQVRPVGQVLDDLPPLPADWLKLPAFAADYYHRPWGEVRLPALPGRRRRVAACQGKRAQGGPVRRNDARRRRLRAAVAAAESPTLNPAQAEAVAEIRACEGYGAFL